MLSFFLFHHAIRIPSGQGCGVGFGVGVARSRDNDPGVGIGVGVGQATSITIPGRLLQFDPVRVGQFFSLIFFGNIFVF